MISTLRRTGAPEIAGSVKSVLIILKQSARSFVDKLDFITSVGHGEGGDSRQRLGLPGAGPVGIITDLCIMEPVPAPMSSWSRRCTRG